MRLLPDIRYGTGRYPGKVARRLRALNLTTWIAAGVGASYSIVTMVRSHTCCGVLLIIVFYALREAARAEAAAEREYERSESLLGNILPATIAGRLKDRTGAVIADRFDEASILFADMAGFTASASDTDRDDLVIFLNKVFTGFDRLVEIHKREKIKTTGDSHLVVSGVPAARPEHAQALAQLALDIRDAAAELRDPHGRSVRIRVPGKIRTMKVTLHPTAAPMVAARTGAAILTLGLSLAGSAIANAAREDSDPCATRVHQGARLVECRRYWHDIVSPLER